MERVILMKLLTTTRTVSAEKNKKQIELIVETEQNLQDIKSGW
jgi:hypothetical protein